MNTPLTVVSGGTGFVGRFIVDGLIEAGHAVRVLGRTAPAPNFFVGPVEFAAGPLEPEIDWSLAMAGATNFVHAAFDHLPGKFRGGEGDDPETFKRRNIEGSEAMFRAAKEAGVSRVVFLSSRAVYGTQPPGALLDETTHPHPDTLYGEVKLAAERRLLALRADGFAPTVLRVTGVYGAAAMGGVDKWTPLIAEWLSGMSVEPRAGSEVHGNDVAAAVELVLTAPLEQVDGEVFNVTDMLVDRNDILSIVQEATGASVPLPSVADASRIHLMTAEKLEALGWKPGGKRRLQETVVDLTRALKAPGGLTA